MIPRFEQTVRNAPLYYTLCRTPMGFPLLYLRGTPGSRNVDTFTGELRPFTANRIMAFDLYVQVSNYDATRLYEQVTYEAPGVRTSDTQRPATTMGRSRGERNLLL